MKSKIFTPLCIFLSSTDSQLKLWNVGKPYCLRSFKGHINEKNFVGLASNGDYIACGKCTCIFKQTLQRRVLAVFTAVCALGRQHHSLDAEDGVLFFSSHTGEN
jgi:hypothetical protein